MHTILSAFTSINAATLVPIVSSVSQIRDAHALDYLHDVKKKRQSVDEAKFCVVFVVYMPIVGAVSNQ